MNEQCKVLIYDAIKGGDMPSSELYLEINGGIEELWNDAVGELDKLPAIGDLEIVTPEFQFRVQIEHESGRLSYKDDNGDDILITCREMTIILSLLHCFPESAVTVRKFNYKGTVYTDIKDTAFLEKAFFSADNGSVGIQYPFRFSAKKDGGIISVYIFGEASTGDYDPDYGRNHIFEKPLSYGIVEVKEKQIYMGTRHSSWLRWKGTLLEDGVYVKDGDLHCFLETDGKSVTFSVLIDGKLYRKISKDDEAVIFYATPFDEGGLSDAALKQDGNPKNIIFRNTGGQYQYSVENKNDSESGFSGVTLMLPPMPDFNSMDSDAACRLYEDYLRAFSDAFSNAEEYKTQIGVFKWDEDAGHMLLAETDDFVLTGKWVQDLEVKDLKEDYTCFENPDNNVHIERASFIKDDIEIALIPYADGTLKIDMTLIDEKDPARNRVHHAAFDELRKRSFFSGLALPETIRLGNSVSSFAQDMEIYRRIKAALLDYGVDKVFQILDKMVQTDEKEMTELLYGEEWVPDKDVIAFAVSMKKNFNRTGKIPNIALIGEAGTGKSEMVKKLGDHVFGKKVMNLSPSDLKGPYLGWTSYKVVEKLAEAAENSQIVLIDEAYELMSDSFGREAVSILLPLMTGNRTQLQAFLRDKPDIFIDFETGEITINKDPRHVSPGVPPIWLAGYEDEIRLMTSQNQGLFRRLQRVELKPPATDDLYSNLKKQLKDALCKLDEGKNSKLLNLDGIDEETKDKMKRKLGTLGRCFEDRELENTIIKFFRWGTQPQNSKYFANYAGVQRFLDCCLDRIDFDSEGCVPAQSKDYIACQIGGIIADIKRDIRRQVDTIRRKGGNDDSNNGSGQYDDSERVEMIFDNETRFGDLIGCDSQIRYMREIIDMFVKKDVYERQNITVPKGALLLGAPGVGKTFIARAMAGELQQKFEEVAPNKRVGFMSLSAPELTSKPVHFISSIFDKAEEYDVCVIFIDEVDAIAKNRFQNKYYSHFIELIKQMDGVGQRSNIFILAATNAYESLDPAFIRAGRIDKKMSFTLPDSSARCALAKISIEKRKGALPNVLPEVFEKNIQKLAKEVAVITYGYTPGDINNVINTAFMMYGRKKDEKGRKSEVMGGGKNPQFGSAELEHLYRLIYEAVEIENIGESNRIKKEKEFSVDKNGQSCSAVSVHEVGHALTWILCGCEPFEKITSLPRGDSLGYVMPNRNVPLTKKDYENRIRTAMGGRIAEEIVYGKDNISVVASGDMKQATCTARMMVEELGFTDEFKFMAFTEVTSRHLDRSGYNCSESFREQSDKVVNKLLKKMYEETREMLADKKELIITLAGQVFKRESMTGKEFIKLYEKQSGRKTKWN